MNVLHSRVYILYIASRSPTYSSFFSPQYISISTTTERLLSARHDIVSDYTSIKSDSSSSNPSPLPSLSQPSLSLYSSVPHAYFNNNAFRHYHRGLFCLSSNCAVGVQLPRRPGRLWLWVNRRWKHRLLL